MSLFPRQGAWSILWNNLCHLLVWGPIVCFSATNRRCSLLIGPGIQSAWALSTNSWKKNVLSILMSKNFFWCQESPLFRHAPILFLVRGLQGNCYFCIVKKFLIPTTSSFTFSGNLMLILQTDYLMFGFWVGFLFILFYTCNIQLCRLHFLNCSLNFYYCCLWVFESVEFFFNDYIAFSISFILAFCDSMCCVFPKCRWGEYVF